MKRKRWRLIIILLFGLLMTGCQVNYNLKILLDGQVEESGIILENKSDILENFDEKDFSKYIDQSLKISDVNFMKSKKIIRDEVAGVELKHKYRNINDYIRRTKAIDYFFSNLKNIKNGHIVELKSEESLYGNQVVNETGELIYKDSSISLSLPYQVISSNADVIDFDSNTFTWNLDYDFDGIDIKYNDSKYYSSNLFKVLSYATITTYSTLILDIFIIILLLAIVLFGFMLFFRQKKIT